MSSSAERTLRIATLISFFFALVFLLPATIRSINHVRGSWYTENSVIGFAFIPLSITVLTSILYLALQHLRKDKTPPSSSSSSSNPLLWAIADFMIFGGYIVVLVFEWAVGINRLNNFPDQAFLEAYATVPLMVNMTIHLVTFLINLGPAAMAWTAATPRECPHCHHRVGASCTNEVAQKGEGYSLLRGEEYDDDAAATGRASEDEDRAALPTVGEV